MADFDLFLVIRLEICFRHKKNFSDVIDFKYDTGCCVRIEFVTTTLIQKQCCASLSLMKILNII